MQGKEFVNQKELLLTYMWTYKCPVNRRSYWKNWSGFQLCNDVYVHVTVAGNLHGYKEFTLWISHFRIQGFSTNPGTVHVAQNLCRYSTLRFQPNVVNACTPVYYTGTYSVFFRCFYLQEFWVVHKVHMKSFIIWEIVHLVDWRLFKIYSQELNPFST